MPDAVGFYTDLTGQENLRYTSRLNRIPEQLAESTIEEVLEQVGLTSRADDQVETYSRGMLQRLGIADALVKDPDVLILDEPTTAIDPLGVVEILDLLRRLVRERGMAILLSSHLLNQVQSVCDGSDLRLRPADRPGHARPARGARRRVEGPRRGRVRRRRRGRRREDRRGSSRASTASPRRSPAAARPTRGRWPSPWVPTSRRPRHVPAVAERASSSSRCGPSSRRSRTSIDTRSPGPRRPTEKSSDRTRSNADRAVAPERAAERSVPRAGWMVIARKEFADHILSARFFVLLLLLSVVAAVPFYLTADVIRSAASNASGGQAIFIALFWYTPPLPLLANEATLPSVAGFFGLVAPLLGSFGSTRSTASAPRGRCRGCCPSRSTATT